MSPNSLLIVSYLWWGFFAVVSRFPPELVRGLQVCLPDCLQIVFGFAPRIAPAPSPSVPKESGSEPYDCNGARIIQCERVLNTAIYLKATAVPAFDLPFSRNFNLTIFDLPFWNGVDLRFRNNCSPPLLKTMPRPSRLCALRGRAGTLPPPHSLLRSCLPRLRPRAGRCVPARRRSPARIAQTGLIVP